MSRVAKYLLLPCVLLFLSCGGSKSITTIPSTTPDLDAERLNRYYINAVSAKVKEDYPTAKELFNKCLKLDKNNAASHYQLADVYKILSNYDSALSYAKNALELEPKNKWYREINGDLYWITRDRPKAILLYEGLLEEFPETRAYYSRLQEFYNREKNTDKEIELVKKEIAYFGSNNKRISKLSNLLLSQGKNEEAKALWLKEIKENPLNDTAYEKLGRIYFFGKEQEKLETHYKEAFEKLPYNSKITKAYIEHVLLAKPLNAIMQFMADDSQPKEVKLFVYERVNGKDKKKAVAKYLIVNNLASDDVILNEAVYLEKQGKYKEAVSYFEKVAYISSDGPLESYFIALLAAGELLKAEEVLERLEEMFPFSNSIKSYRDQLNNAKNK